MPLLTAADVFARSLSTENTGRYVCHWCGSHCSDKLYHDDPFPIPFNKTKTTAKVKISPYVCMGCWLYRRKSVTVRFLDESFVDRKCAMDCSWFITSEDSKTIKPENAKLLYDLLLKPPLVFVLALRDDPKTQNHLHLMLLNNNVEVKGDTELFFTLNNIPHTYTVYELEEALKRGETGKEPGVQALVRMFGEYQEMKEAAIVEKRDGAGRPPDKEREVLNDPKKVITTSKKK